MNKVKDSKLKKKMNARQRLSCAMGNLLNDIVRQTGMSFEILFFMKVVELSPWQAGMILLIGQCTDAFISPINGYLGDHVKIPFLSNKMGLRKSWHFIGTILMAIAFPLVFNRCLLCSEYRDATWLPFAYYGTIMAAINVAYNIVEINHLSIISVVTDTKREATALNALK